MNILQIFKLASFFHHSAIKAEELIKVAIKKNELINLLNKPGETFGIISVYQTKNKNKNKLKHSMVTDQLQKLNLDYHEIEGQWLDKPSHNVEKSILIPNIKPETLFELGQLFKQDAVIYKGPDGIIGMYYLHNNKAEVAVDINANPSYQILLDSEMAKNNHTAKAPLKNKLWSKTKDLSFTFNFLWGEEIPWDGTNPIDKDQVLHLIQSGFFKGFN